MKSSRRRSSDLSTHQLHKLRCRGSEDLPRIGLSRSIYIAPTRAEALADAESGMRRHAEFLAQRTGQQADLPLEVPLPRADVHSGSPDDVIASLRADALLPRATDLILQVNPVDPPHDKTLRSLELIGYGSCPSPGLAARERGRTCRQSGATRPA